MSPDQMKRVAQIAADNMLDAYAAILIALADPLLKKDLTKFEPDWMQYKMGLRDGYAEALEQAAKVCDSEATCEGIAQKCAAAIRAMKVEK